jgi:hypothetical protein
MHARATSLLLIAFSFVLAAASAPTQVILLPEMLAVELPAPELKEIAPNASPMKELLEAARADGFKVTHDRNDPLPLGRTVVTWTAWEGEAGNSAVRAKKSAQVYVFPFGHVPVGISRDDHATAGNHAPKIVRDARGKLHMAWLDGGPPRPGFRVMYRRAQQDPVTGTIRWETNPVRVSDPASEAWNSYLAMEASEGAIHFAWQGPRSVHYRRLVGKENGWSFDPIRDSRATGLSVDNGPDMAVRGDDEIHLLTASGRYAISKDGGSSWTLDQVPRTPGGGMKNPALAVDKDGTAHIVFIATIRNAKWSTSKPNAGYWELRYVRRLSGSGWVDEQNVLAAFPQWADPHNEWDVLADWPDIAVDRNNHIHVVWHGTSNTHIFGNDEAFYSRRPAESKGVWGKWGDPQSLFPVDVAKAEFFSFAPSLSVDPQGDATIAVVFFDRSHGNHILDFDGRVLRNGVLQGGPIGITRLARTDAVDDHRLQNALSAWFPTAAPRLFHDSNGRVWLDVLYTAATPERDNLVHIIVYARHEVTGVLRQPEH